MKYSKGIELSNGEKYEIIPPSPTEKIRGGIKAKAKTNESVEVVIGEDGKAYVPKYPSTAKDVGALPFPTIINATITITDNVLLKGTVELDKTYEEICELIENGENVAILDNFGITYPNYYLNGQTIMFKGIAEYLDGDNNIFQLDIIIRINSDNCNVFLSPIILNEHWGGIITDIDKAYVKKTGDTMTGALTVNEQINANKVMIGNNCTLEYTDNALNFIFK